MKLLNKDIIKLLFINNFLSLELFIKSKEKKVVELFTSKVLYKPESIEQLLEKYPDFPIKKFKHSDNTYSVPYMFNYDYICSEMRKVYKGNTKKVIDALIEKLSKLSLDLQKVQANKSDFYTKLTTVDKNLMEQINIQKQLVYTIIEQQLYNNCNNILTSQFWDYVPKKSMIVKKSEVNNIIKVLLEFFENDNDIASYQNMLSATYGYSNVHDIQIILYHKLLEKKSIGKQGKNLPNIIKSKLRKTNVSRSIMEILKIYQYFTYEEIKEDIVYLFEKNNNANIISACKEILDKNDYFNKDKNKVFLVEDKNSIVYVKVMKIDVLFLREKANNNKILTQTLIGLSLSTLKENYKVVISSQPNIIELKFHSQEQKDLEKFKQYVEQLFNFSFTNYIDGENSTKLSKIKNGRKVYYEEDEKIKDNFNKEFNVFCLKDKLENQLHSKIYKHKVEKI